MTDKMTQLKDRAEATATLALADKLLGLPARGVHVGGGVHVDMPQAFKPGAPGWTETAGTADDDGLLILPAEFEAKLQNAEAREKLGPDELAKLEALAVEDATDKPSPSGSDS